MGYTVEQRDALREAIATGVLTISAEGKTITYRSMEELKQALDAVEAELAKDAGSPRLRQLRIYSTKGF